MPRRNRPGQGRKRQPPELKILHGTFKAHRDGDKDLLKLDSGERPECPAHLVAYDPLCATYWANVCDVMERHGLPFAGTEVPLELFVKGYADLRRDMQHPMAHDAELHRHVKKTVKLPDGREILQEWYEVKSNPVRKEMRQITAELHRLAADLGLTASARARMLAEMAGGQGVLSLPGGASAKAKQRPVVETRRR